MDIVMNRLVLGLLAMTPVLGAQTRAEVVPLQQRSLRNWQIALPNETWVKIGSSIDLASHSFAVRAKGTGVGIDTDADGEINVVVQDKSGFVKLRDGSYRYAIELANRGAGWFYRSAVGLFIVVDFECTKVLWPRCLRAITRETDRQTDRSRCASS